MISLAYIALWIFVFSLPWDTVLVIPGIGVLSKLTGALALGLALLAVSITGRVRRWHLFHIAAFLFVIWTGGVILFVYNPHLIPKKFWTFVQLFLVLWMIWELAPSRKRLVGLLVAYVLGAYVAAFETIMVYRREAGAVNRFAAGETDENDLAMTLALALPMAWYLGMTSSQPLLRWVCRGYLPVGVFAIGLTGSRGGMLATIVALLIVPLTMTKLTPGKMVTSIAILIISGAVAVAYVPQTIVERLATTRSEFEDGSLGGRFKLWVAGVRAFTRKPVVGYGAASFKQAVAPFLVTPPQVAHNSYLSVLVEEGIVGFLLYLLMLIAVFLALLDLPLLERRFALVLLATVAVAMLPLTWEDRKAVWFILAALLGLAQAHITRSGRTVRQAVARRAPAFARPPVGARGVETAAAPRRPLDPDVSL